MNRLVALLAAIRDALPAGPLVVFGGYTEHAGDVYNGWDSAEDDEPCVCDPDGPQHSYVLMPIASAADLFAEAIRRSDNGALADDVAWDMARSLELGGDVA